MGARNFRSPVAQPLTGRGPGKELESHRLLGPIPVAFRGVFARIPRFARGPHPKDATVEVLDNCARPVRVRTGGLAVGAGCPPAAA